MHKALGASLHEVKHLWTVQDLLEAHLVLDAQEIAEEDARAKAQRRR